MSHLTILKIVYGLIALISALTIGIFVSIFLAVITLFQVFVSFPVRIYKSLLEAEITRLKMQAFNVRTNEEYEEQSVSDRMWEKHIQRMKEKQSNKKDEI